MKPTRNLMAAALADLNRSVEECDAVPEEWKTVQQWAKLSGKSRATVGRKLAILASSGEWEMRKFRIDLGSKTYPLPHYRKKG